MSREEKRDVMLIRHNHSRFQMSGRAGASVLALAGLLVAAGCSSSSGSASGTYRPYPETSSGAYWPGEPKTGTHINVSLSERKLYLKDGPRVVQTYSIGIGRDSDPTPIGDYRVQRIVWNPPWNPPDEPWAAGRDPEPPGSPTNPMKVVKLYFREPDYYIHGTGNLESLGGAVSRGCLRMAPADAASLARHLMDHGGAGRDASWFARVQGSNVTETVNLGTAVPMHVGP
jgi:hypothetical protein